jgi:uncharacterized membrane protein
MSGQGWTLAAVLGLVLSACSDGSAAYPTLPAPVVPLADPDADVAACVRKLPAACPTPSPSYETQIDPIIQNRCWPCHATGGAGAASGHPFTDYNLVHKDRGAILDQVYACNMPPSGATALSDEERTAMLAWLVCGAQQN